jgi:hypothetical protein
MGGSCSTHHPATCQRYAVAVDWALLRDLVEDRHGRHHSLLTICEHLGTMEVPWARSLYGSLDCARWARSSARGGPAAP